MDDTFQRWVEAYGGPYKLAAKLGVTRHGVQRWLRREGWPKVEVIIEIIRLSKGALTFETITECSATREQRKALKW